MTRLKLKDTRQKRQQRPRGQALVEFALILPILLLLVVAIFDFGRALFVFSEVSNSAREAVRYGTNTDVADPNTLLLDCSSISSRAVSMFSIAPTTIAINVYIERPSGSSFNKLPCASTKVQTGDRVRVEVNATVQLVTMELIGGLFGNNAPKSLPVTYAASRTLLPQGGISTGPTTTPPPFSDVTISTAPANFSVTCSASTPLAVDASWNSVAGATGYRIYKGATVVWDGSTPPAIGFDSVADNTPTSYSITAYNANGEGPHSSSVSVTCSFPPAAPTNFSATSDCTGANKVAVSWNAVTGAAGYHVYRGSVIIQSGTATSYTNVDTVGNPSSTSYSVTAYNAGGVEGPHSTVVVVTCPLAAAPPAAPANFSATSTCSGSAPYAVNASWSAATGATGYHIYKGAAVVWTGAALSANGFDSVNDFVSTSYSVTAYNANGESPHSSPAVVMCGSLPAAPANFNAASTCSGSAPHAVQASWDAVTGATGYSLYKETTSIWNGTALSADIPNSVSDYTPTNYSVAAYNAGGEGPHSNVVVVTCGQAPPSNFKVACGAGIASGRIVTFTWTQTANTTYRLYDSNTVFLNGVNSPVTTTIPFSTTKSFSIDATSALGTSPQQAASPSPIACGRPLAITWVTGYPWRPNGAASNKTTYFRVRVTDVLSGTPVINATITLSGTNFSTFRVSGASITNLNNGQYCYLWVNSPPNISYIALAAYAGNTDIVSTNVATATLTTGVTTCPP
jgi:fibronectin type 3 domain-containing protein